MKWLITFAILNSNWAWTLPICAEELKALMQKPRVDLKVGIADVHSYRVGDNSLDTIVSIYTPTSTNPNTQILDFQFLKLHEAKPRKFISSGGGVFDTFYYFDLSENSLLRKRLKNYLSVIRKDFENSGENDFNNFLIKALLNQSKFNSDLFFDKPLDHSMRTNFRVGEDAENILKDFLNRPFTGPNPIISKNSREAIPFSAALDPDRKLLCFEKAWIASLILDEAGIPNRLRFGQVSFAEPNTFDKNGHVVIELENNQLLDVEWKYLGKAPSHSEHEEWRWIDTGPNNPNEMWWSPYRHYPALVIE